MKKIIFISVFLILFCNIFAQNQTPVNSKSFMISHSYSQTIDINSSAICNDQSQFVYENSFYRAFDLFNFFNIYGDWVVQKIDFAVAKALSNNSSQEITLNFYSLSLYNYKIVLDSLTLLGSQKVNIPNNETQQIKSITLNSPINVPEGKTLVVEILVPDGIANQNILYIGSNSLGQSDITYIRAPNCYVQNPTNFAEVGYPDMMLIMNVYGDYASPNPRIISFIIPDQVAETVILNEPQYTIDVIMPLNHDLTALTPEIFIPAGFQISPASGQTVDFSGGPVIYSVTNEYKRITQTWSVTARNAPPYIIDFSVPGMLGEAVITREPEYTVQFNMPSGSDLGNLPVSISVFDGYSVSPANGENVNFADGPVNFNVYNTELSISQNWTVTASNYSRMKNIPATDLLNVYPVPAKNSLNIALKGKKSIKIFDNSGKLILSEISANDIQTLDISKLKPGVYLLQIIHEKSIYNKKIVKIQYY